MPKAHITVHQKQQNWQHIPQPRTINSKQPVTQTSLGPWHNTL